MTRAHVYTACTVSLICKHLILLLKCNPLPPLPRGRATDASHRRRIPRRPSSGEGETRDDAPPSRDMPSPPREGRSTTTTTTTTTTTSRPRRRESTTRIRASRPRRCGRRWNAITSTRCPLGDGTPSFVCLRYVVFGTAENLWYSLIVFCGDCDWIIFYF